MRRSILLRLVDLWFLLLGCAATLSAFNAALHTHGFGRTLALALLTGVFAAVTAWAGRAVVRDWA